MQQNKSKKKKKEIINNNRKIIRDDGKLILACSYALNMDLHIQLQLQ